MQRNHQGYHKNHLRKYRKARGLKQTEVAAILGLRGTATISRWEKGVRLPDTLNVFKLAALYRTMPDALFLDLSRKLKSELLVKEEEVLNCQNNYYSHHYATS